MIPDLSQTSKRFRLTIFTSNGDIIADLTNVRTPHFIPELGTVMFETEERLRTTISNPNGAIFLQEMDPASESLVEDREENLIGILEAA